jgi:hypothetical protein
MGKDEMTVNPSTEHILQVGLGFWASKTLLSAVEMEVFTELAKKPEDLETLRGRLGLHPRSDCTRWMKEAGFRETRVEHLVGPDSMVVGIK